MPRILDTAETLRAQNMKAIATRYGRTAEVQRWGAMVFRLRAANLRTVADEMDRQADAMLVSVPVSEND